MGHRPVATGREKGVGIPSWTFECALPDPVLLCSLGACWHNYNLSGSSSGRVSGVKVMIIKPPNTFTDRGKVTKSARDLLRMDMYVFQDEVQS